MILNYYYIRLKQILCFFPHIPTSNVVILFYAYILTLNYIKTYHINTKNKTEVITRGRGNKGEQRGKAEDPDPRA
jgi:hypothetical protein